MFSLNKVMLAGNLTRDPENKSTASGTSICEFGLAINRKSKDRDETCFVNITVFGKLADVCRQFLCKGSAVYIDGRLVFESWEDRSGAKRSALKVVAESVQFLSSNREGGGNAESRGERRNQQQTAPKRRFTADDYPEPRGGRNSQEEELPPF